MGEEVGVIIFVVVVVLSFIILGYSAIEKMDDQYIQFYNKCVLDCDRAGQLFFDYQVNYYSENGRKCFCLLDNDVNEIW